MDTKEAIKWFKYLPVDSEYNKDIVEIITLLERGEKHEAMWKELYQDFVRNKEERNISGYSYMIDMRNIKRKHFPEPIKKTITIEIEGEEENISKFTGRLNAIVGQINFGVRTNIKEGD